jgi:hypothetical protein
MGMGSAKLVKAGFVVLDTTGAISKIVVFQYNPETLLRRLDGVVPVAPPPATRSPGATAVGGVAPGAGAAGGVATGAGVTTGAAAGGASGAVSAGGAATAAAGGGASGAGSAGGVAGGAAAGAAAVLQPEPHETVSFTLTLDAADKLEAGDPITQQNGLLPAMSALELLLYPAGNAITVWVSGSRRVVPVRITEMQVVEQAFDPALNPIRAEVAVTLQVLKDADLVNNPRGRALWDAHFATLQQLAKLVGGGTLGALGLTGI